MINKMAEEQVTDFSRRGITLTPNEIVILHTLAVAVQRSREVAKTFAAPRIVDVGNTTLYEPTVAAELWIQEYAALWWENDDLMTQGALLWAAAHALRPAAFGLTDEREARKVIHRWLKGRDATTTQLLVALVYVMRGVELTTPPELEDIVTTKKRTDAEEGEYIPATADDNYALRNIWATIHDVLATGNLTMDDIKRMPRRQLVDIYVRAMRYKIASIGVSVASMPVSSREFLRYQNYVEWLENKYFPEADNGET